MAIVTLAKRPDDVCFSGSLRDLIQHHRNLVINQNTPQKVPKRSTDVLSTTIKASPLKDPSSTTVEEDSDENTQEDEVEGIVEGHAIAGQPDFDDECDDAAYFEFLSSGALLEGLVRSSCGEMKSDAIDTLPPVKSAGVPEPVGPDKDAPTGSASPQEQQEQDAGEAPPPPAEQQQQPQEQAPSSGDSEGSSSPTQPPRGIPGQSSSDEMPDIEDDAPAAREPHVAEDAVAPVVRPGFGPQQQQADREGEVPRGGYPGEPEPEIIFHFEEPGARVAEESSDSSDDSSDSEGSEQDDEERPEIPLPEYYVDPDDEQEEEEEPEEEQNPQRNSGTSDSSPDSGSSGSGEDASPRDSEESDDGPVDIPREDSPMPYGEEEDEEEAAELGQNQDSSPEEESEDANPLKRPHGDDDDESGDSKRPHIA